MQAELVLDAKATLGEGALWDAAAQRLLWIDIMENKVFRYDPVTGANQATDTGQHVGTVVPRARGGLTVALHHGFAHLDPDTGAVEIFADPESDRPTNRFNDGKCDPAGRFWAGTMPMADGGPVGALYRLDPDGTVTRMVDQVSCSNGIVWSHDRCTMYFIDTPTAEVSAFDYDLDTGEICNRRTAVKVAGSEGYPDGMTIDADGNLWVACWNGRQVGCWDPNTGRKLATVAVPAQNVTSCAFGGRDLDILYITSARAATDDKTLTELPLCGGLFSCRPGVRGVEACPYAG